jgi:hypothetical protein
MMVVCGGAGVRGHNELGKVTDSAVAMVAVVEGDHDQVPALPCVVDTSTSSHQCRCGGVKRLAFAQATM